MIVISAGLPKSGSGLLFNLTNDLLEAAGNTGVRDLRERHHLENILKHLNCNIGTPDWAALRHLLPLHFRGNRFVVKTHQGPNATVRRLMKLGIIRSTFIFRDPRDVVLSAMDHGRRIRGEGKSHTFAKCHSMEDTVHLAMKWLEETTPWIKESRVLCFRYEDLLADPLHQLERLAAFLKIDSQSAGIDLAGLYNKYDVSRNSGADTQGLHWNRGIAGRFRREMSTEHLDFSTRAFREYLPALGYEE